MKCQLLILFCLVIFNSTITNSQIRDYCCIANWNLENLFDTVDDPGKDDSEFTPTGAKQWDQEKLNLKFSKLAAVINSMNSDKGPDLLGVEEVEHKSLLDTLINNYLNIKNYKVAYAESPDERGIDVGLIYNSDLFKLISIKADTVNLPKNDKTRLILNVILKTKNGDQLFIFVNHWPSRRGGEKESEINRIIAASILRVEVNKILLTNANSKILILGDFNDEPGNKSVSETLKAMDFDCSNLSSIGSLNLYNLAYKDFTEDKGTILYQSDWNLIDQIIISGNLLRNNYECNSFEIYKPEFLLTRTGKYKGSAFPTYGNKGKYLGGYSDHFPVIAKFRLE
jgi:predicted extracellular nuclease